ncbi:MAG: hypothetical protein SFX19_10070 [Alphaproteobacteria bacterium]|nr:hypothetical protein [Alphaproteobacteria bacterium]
MRTTLKLPHLTSVHDLFGFNPLTKQKYKMPHYRKWLAAAKGMVECQSHHHHRHKGKVKMTLHASKIEYTPETIYLLETAVLELLVQQKIITAWDQVVHHKIEWLAEMEGSLVLVEDSI